MSLGFVMSSPVSIRQNSVYRWWCYVLVAPLSGAEPLPACLGLSLRGARGCEVACCSVVCMPVLIDNPLAVTQCSVTDRPTVALLVFEGDAFCTLLICIVMLVIMLLVLHQSVTLINEFIQYVKHYKEGETTKVVTALKDIILL